MCLFTKMMQKYKCIIFIIKEHYTVITRAKFPYAILKMLCYLFAKSRTIIFKELYILGNLLMLDTCIFICRRTAPEIIKKLFYVTITIFSSIEINVIHPLSPYSLFKFKNMIA